MPKTFDSVNCYCLCYKRLSISTKGRDFGINILGWMSDCFSYEPSTKELKNINQQVEQGCTISTRLFSICINYLVQNSNNMNSGILLDNQSLSNLLHADDSTRIATTQNDELFE